MRCRPAQSAAGRSLPALLGCQYSLPPRAFGCWASNRPIRPSPRRNEALLLGIGPAVCCRKDAFPVAKLWLVAIAKGPHVVRRWLGEWLALEPRLIASCAPHMLRPGDDRDAFVTTTRRQSHAP
jgi:hypothetical protein